MYLLVRRGACCFAFVLRLAVQRSGTGLTPRLMSARSAGVVEAARAAERVQLGDENEASVLPCSDGDDDCTMGGTDAGRPPELSGMETETSRRCVCVCVCVCT